jgi:tRNA dimethylallyltransferase
VASKYLFVIAGPTAIGKTDLAIRIANQYDTEIISADSRQFYREISIGTAKPSPEELSAVHHHFINSHSVTEEFNVGDFEAAALSVLDNIYKRKNIAVLAGGSGLYINAVTNGFDDLPKGDPAIRQNLNQTFKEEGISPLQHQLKQLDPVYFQAVDINNPQRIIRALEVCLSTGSPFSSFREGTKKERYFKIIKIGLNTDREKLYERINFRVDQMIKSGLVDEVRGMLKYKNFNALKTVGYSEIFEYLEEKISLEEAIEMIKQNTRRFAKRQLTWFRKDKDINWYDPADASDILKFLDQQITTEQ